MSDAVESVAQKFIREAPGDFDAALQYAKTNGIDVCHSPFRTMDIRLNWVWFVDGSSAVLKPPTTKEEAKLVLKRGEFKLWVGYALTHLKFRGGPRLVLTRQ